MKKIKRQNSRSNNDKRILIACIGQCVHVAGAHNFMNIATHLGYECKFLGPATPIWKLINEMQNYNPGIVGLSYRLTPSTVKPLLKNFFKNFENIENKPSKLYFAGTSEVINVAKEFKQFNEYFIGGESKHRVIAILKDEKQHVKSKLDIPMDLISRIEWKKPYPIIRAHFGLSNFKETVRGIKIIANAEVLDVISIAPDQNTQANYFHPEQQIQELSGAGGVPLRTEEDFLKLHKARLTGNHPLLRIYAGTRDFIKLAELYQRTIKNVWAAIPIFWFNQMDGRGPLSLKESIKQHLKTIQWYAENDVPVEINDPHHWSLRDAPDVIAVADMYLSGIIAKKLGVKYFIAQYMFNTPPSSSLDMDFAKILAKDELLQTLVDNSFSVIKQVRTGLASFPIDLDKAKGQLAAATLIQLAIKPDIVHVVSYSEANHAARPDDIIESCNIVDQVINTSFSSKLNFIDKKIRKRKEELIREAQWIINLIPRLAKTYEEQKNPLINYKILNRLVEYGIFDAPHLKNNPFALGKIKTKIINGACCSWDIKHQKVINERERIKKIVEKCSNILISEDKFQKEFFYGKVMNE
ncbi:MAG: methionine synthase [Promethearchaeota archaeon]